MKLDISNVEFHLNFQKKFKWQIMHKLDIANVEFYMLLDFIKIEFQK